GLDDAWPVASEPFTQWVIEDRFPAGRPPDEEAGATRVADVHADEAIKLRLLNGGHQAVAYIGRLAGYELVDEAITDPRIAAWVRRYMEREGVPTLTPPEGFDIPAYIDELFARFGNANVADTLARLGTDASNRIPKFVVPTLRDRIATGAAAETGAELIASWRAFTRRAAAGEFTLDDESAAELMEAATGAPLDFLALPTLAGLADSAGFVAAYLDAARRLEGGGAEAFLAG
ncbi:MAG: mannitol dehydrogenase family protein, partial [Protaetiibacter sp.]